VWGAGRAGADVDFEGGDWRTVYVGWCEEEEKSGGEKNESQHFAGCLGD
jgi:hypothetical protein